MDTVINCLLAHRSCSKLSGGRWVCVIALRRLVSRHCHRRRNPRRDFHRIDAALRKLLSPNWGRSGRRPAGGFPADVGFPGRHRRRRTGRDFHDHDVVGRVNSRRWLWRCGGVFRLVHIVTRSSACSYATLEIHPTASGPLSVKSTIIITETIELSSNYFLNLVNWQCDNYNLK